MVTVKMGVEWKVGAPEQVKKPAKGQQQSLLVFGLSAHYEL